MARSADPRTRRRSGVPCGPGRTFGRSTTRWWWLGRRAPSRPTGTPTVVPTTGRSRAACPPSRAGWPCTRATIPFPAPVRHPAQGGQGRIVPLRRQLRPAVRTRGLSTADDRHRNEPHRLSNRAEGSTRKSIESLLPSWRPGATRNAVTAFLHASADVASDVRVAVFDNDGTLWCEKPRYIQLDFIVAELAKAVADRPCWPTVRGTRPSWATDQPCAYLRAVRRGQRGSRGDRRHPGADRPPSDPCRR
jgi:hypothetical protein